MKPNPTHVRVLLIEDSESDALLVESSLKGQPLAAFEITHVQTLQEARTSLRDQQFEAILMDIGLPDNEGFDGLTELHRTHPGVPIIALSGWPDHAAARQAVEAGAMDYLVKGQIPPDLLQHAILHAVTHPRTPNGG